MRLNKYLASCGLGSRRKVEEIISAGRVKVAGKVAGLSTIVSDNDIVEVDGKRVSVANTYEYILLNKPKGYLCTTSDDRGRPTVLDLVRSKNRLFPVGRLDYNSEGMIILTNDGDFANDLIHPSHGVTKTYDVKTKYPLNDRELSALAHGVDVGVYVTAPAVVEDCSCDSDGKYHTYITLFEGKNRELRRIFETFSLQILSLKRIRIGSLELGDLPVGKYRRLSNDELRLLKMSRVSKVN